MPTPEQRYQRLTIQTVTTANSLGAGTIKSNGVLLTDLNAVCKLTVYNYQSGAVLFGPVLMTYVAPGIWQYDLGSSIFLTGGVLTFTVSQYAIDGTTLQQTLDLRGIDAELF